MLRLFRIVPCASGYGGGQTSPVNVMNLMVVCMAGWNNQQQEDVIDYLGRTQARGNAEHFTRFAANPPATLRYLRRYRLICRTFPMTKQTSRRGSAKVVVLLLIVAFLGIAVVGAGALLYLNRDKFNIAQKDKAEDESQSSESADPSARPSSSGGAGLIPVKQLDTLRSARRNVVGSAPIHANERNYATYAERTDVLVLVDYYADWCPPCRAIAPFLSKLAAQHGDKVIVLKVNIDREKGLASRAGVSGIPDVRLLHGGSQLERIVGGRPYQVFESMVLKHENLLNKSIPATRDTAKNIAPSPVPSGGKPLRPTSAPAPARPSEPDPVSSGGGAITPFKKDWLPPGVTPIK